MHAVIAIAFLFTAAAPEAPSSDAVREAVARSLPYIEKEGRAWIKERKCNSCHVVSFMLWAHQEALTAGIKLDRKSFDDFADWSLSYALSARQWHKLTEQADEQLKADGVPEPTRAKLKPLWNKPFISDRDFVAAIGKIVPADELDPHRVNLVQRSLQPKTGEKNDLSSMATIGQLLVGMATSKHPRMEELRKAAPDTMAKWQEKSGAWKAGGQLPKQNRTPAEADEVVTAWALLGLATLAETDPAIQKMTDAGLAYLKKSKPGQSHERLLVQMLVEHQFGNPDAVGGLLEEVFKRQNTDGGWGWSAGGKSDAFATGQTLYAISFVATRNERTSIRRAQNYLLDTQTKEGIWQVPPLAITDPKSNEARVQRLVPIYHYWGTTWAAIGLSRSIEAAQVE